MLSTLGKAYFLTLHLSRKALVSHLVGKYSCGAGGRNRKKMRGKKGKKGKKRKGCGTIACGRRIDTRENAFQEPPVYGKYHA
jgi:hypothetical protein